MSRCGGGEGVVMYSPCDLKGRDIGRMERRVCACVCLNSKAKTPSHWRKAGVKMWEVKEW